MRNSNPAREIVHGSSWFERLANYTANHGWLIAKVVFAAHYILWLVFTYFPIFWIFNYDTKIYRAAAAQIALRQPIYWLGMTWPTQDPYYYSPQFAWLCSLFNSIDGRAFAFLFGVGVLAVPFVLSLKGWQNLAGDLNLDKDTIFRWLPLALLATSTIYNFVAGNIVVLLTGLLGMGLFCILRQRSLPAAIILVVMILTKPQFAAPLLVVLLFGLAEKASQKSVLQTAGYAMVMYLVITGIFLVAVGPGYGAPLLVDQVRLLLQATAHYPYVGADVFFTVNNSFDQQFYRLGLGSYAWISTILKVCFGLYFVWLLYKSFRAKIGWSTHARYVVLLALMSYLVISSFTWQMMELLAGPIILAFLLSWGEAAPHIRRGRWVLTLLFVWELIVPVVFVIPTSLIALLVLFWFGNQVVNFGLKRVEPSFVPSRV